MKDEAWADSSGCSSSASRIDVSFEALEYHADDSVRPSRWTYRGSPDSGYLVLRQGVEHLRLGPGYVLVDSVACGVCSTDLARRHLPFPLPQIIGHEVVVRDSAGQRFVVEINASHAARGVSIADCPSCSTGLATHCPERLVLGIHDLPGGFGRRLLVPKQALIPLPDDLPTNSAVLIEPLAAALHAVETVRPRPGESIAVLGPRRLGLLVIAALRAWRAESGVAFEIVGVTRNSRMEERARSLGADRVEVADDQSSTLPDRAFDAVIDTTGNPAALPVALRLARREVHLKSTHGQPALGVRHWTELVVDELSIEAWSDSAPEAVDLRAVGTDSFDGIPPPRSVVVDPAGIDGAIRPRADAVAAVRPRGRIYVGGARGVAEQQPLLDALASGVVVTSSRCGDFHRALQLIATDSGLRGLGESFVTHSFEAKDLGEALATARTSECVKAVVCHR